MIDQLRETANLPWDNNSPAPAFRKYTDYTAKASGWLKQNALPLIGLALAVAI